jgi:hypothetical protein
MDLHWTGIPVSIGLGETKTLATAAKGSPRKIHPGGDLHLPHGEEADRTWRG